jgi:hypothetical protein
MRVRNKSFHEHNGEHICKVVGVILAGCFFPIILKAIGCLIVGIVLACMFADLYKNI